MYPATFFLNSVHDICGGNIGATGLKFCCRGKDCTIAKHRSSKNTSIQPGVYVKDSSFEAFVDPFVDKLQLSKDTVQELLLHESVDDELMSKFVAFKDVDPNTSTEKTFPK